MKKWMSVFFLIIGLVFIPQLAHSAVKIGQQAPDFSLQDTNGKNKSLSGYRGKYVVLEWINHDCPFVRKHYNSKNMQSLQSQYTQKGVVWLSVNSSAHGKQGHYHGNEANQLTAQKGASPTAVLLDADGIVGKTYGAQTTPHMYIIDPKGKLIYQGAIDSVPSANPEDIAKSTNYVAQALNESMAGKPVSMAATKSYGCSVKY